MNANELIKRMEDGYSVSYDEIIAMLRQQQAEIEALKNRELTNEEKWEVFTNLARSPDLRTDMIRFANSILLKAQEK